jgi:hypothetical protein
MVSVSDIAVSPSPAGSCRRHIASAARPVEKENSFVEKPFRRIAGRTSGCRSGAVHL